MTLSASAIIVIALCCAGMAVTILFTFSRYLGKEDNMLETPVGRSHEQDLYMRQVRQRSHEYAYAESLSGGVSTTRTSQVWSNAGAPTTPATLGAGAGAAGGSGQRRASQGQQSQGYFHSNNSYVNYSKYEDEQYYEQSPYDNGSNGYDPQQQPLRQTQEQYGYGNAAGSPSAEASKRPLDENPLPPQHQL